MFLDIPLALWKESATFYFAMLVIFLVMRRFGIIESRFTLLDIPIRLPIFYIVAVGAFRALIPGNNHGSGYAPWVQDTVCMMLIALPYLFIRPRKAVLGLLSPLLCLAFFYALDYFNVWTDYDVWLERGARGKLQPPYGPHRWWWE